MASIGEIPSLIRRVLGWRLVRVSGDSMLPGFSSGSMRFAEVGLFNRQLPQRGDVALLRLQPRGEYYIKRVVGLPNELVEVRGGSVLINGSKLEEGYTLPSQDDTHQAWKTGDGEYITLGDNRALSQDSRVWGKLNLRQFAGKVRG